MKYFIEDIQVSQETYESEMYNEIYRQETKAAPEKVDDYGLLLPYQKGLAINYLVKERFQELKQLSSVQLYSKFEFYAEDSSEAAESETENES